MRSSLNLIRRHWRPLLFASGCAFLSSPGQTFFIALFVGQAGQTLGLDAAQLGSLYLFATLGAASLLPLTGQWIDRLDLRLYIVLVVCGLAGACGLMSQVDSTPMLFVAFLLLRLTGQGLMTHVAMTSAARFFDRQRGQALALVAMGLPLAEAAMPALAVAAIAYAGWRGSYALVGGAILIVALPALLALLARSGEFSRPPGQVGTDRATPRLRDAMRLVGRSPFFWLALPALLYLPFTSTALVFHLDLIAQAKGWTAANVAAGFTGFAVGHAGGLLFSGAMIDRFGGRRMLAAMNLPALAGIICLAVFDTVAGLFVFLGALGVASGLVQTSLGAVWVEVYGTARLGTIRSLTVMLMVGGTAAGPAVLGVLLDSGVGLGWIAALLVCAGVMAAALAVLAGGRRGA